MNQLPLNGSDTSSHTANDGVVDQIVEKTIELLFKQLKQIFPSASQTALSSAEKESITRKQWIAAFTENGIRTRAQIKCGLKLARASVLPFWPSPGQFVDWCQRGAAREYGLPDERALFAMVKKYSANNAFYREAGRPYPWKNNACRLMVEKLYSEMFSNQWNEVSIKNACREELTYMTKRLAAGEVLPDPPLVIEKKEIVPASPEKAQAHIARLRKQLDLSKGRTKP